MFATAPHRALLGVLVALLAPAPGCTRSDSPDPSPAPLPTDHAMKTTNRSARIAYLHHSTGQAVWEGGVPRFIQEWNRGHGTDYRIEALTYPATTGGWPPLLRRLARTYPWANYPFDYWNLWVSHRGTERDRGELNLDDLAAKYDVIVFKHCFPVSRVQADGGAPPRVSSQEKTRANYELQYQALKERLHQFPGKRFVLWTGPALPESSTNEAEARRAREFFEWVKSSWDEQGDNVFLWDFRELETRGGLYLQPELAAGARDAHPSPAFARAVAPLLARRIVDVLEDRGDAGSLTGSPP